MKTTNEKLTIEEIEDVVFGSIIEEIEKFNSDDAEFMAYKLTEHLNLPVEEKMLIVKQALDLYPDFYSSI